MNKLRETIEKTMHRGWIPPCLLCASKGRYGVKATQKVGKRMVCTGCARELQPGICARGCGKAIHMGGCKRVNALMRCR